MTRGFTLVELVITISIMSIALLTISQSLAFGVQHSSDGISQSRTLHLAQAYLEEISAKRYSEATPSGGVPPCSPTTVACGSTGPEASELRTTFDDIDDYDGLIEQPPRDAQGNLRAGYESYRVAVTVRYLTAAEVTALGLDDTTDAKKVLVQVTPPAQTPQEFVSVYGNF